MNTPMKTLLSQLSQIPVGFCLQPAWTQRPGSDDYHLSLVEILEATRRTRRCARLLPSFGLAKLIHHLSQHQPETNDLRAPLN